MTEEWDKTWSGAKSKMGTEQKCERNSGEVKAKNCIMYSKLDTSRRNV